VTHDQTEAITLGDLVAVMRQGVIQQVAEPHVLFDKPANLFVAGFIGSPAMTLVEATLERVDGAVYAAFGGTRLRVPEELLAERRAVRRYAGRRVVLGIRPEDMEDASLVADTPGDARLSASVELRETLGREAYLYFTVAAPPVLTEDIKELAADTDAAALGDLEEQRSERVTRFIARVSAKTRGKEGRPVDLAVDTAGLHFFDLDTGWAIYHEARPPCKRVALAPS
jgi:multiple sugar transport system ATP-binding protein